MGDVLFELRPAWDPWGNGLLATMCWRSTTLALAYRFLGNSCWPVSHLVSACCLAWIPRSPSPGSLVFCSLGGPSSVWVVRCCSLSRNWPSSRVSTFAHSDIVSWSDLCHTAMRLCAWSPMQTKAALPLQRSSKRGSHSSSLATLTPADTLSHALSLSLSFSRSLSLSLSLLVFLCLSLSLSLCVSLSLSLSLSSLSLSLSLSLCVSLSLSRSLSVYVYIYIYLFV